MKMASLAVEMSKDLQKDEDKRQLPKNIIRPRKGPKHYLP